MSKSLEKFKTFQLIESSPFHPVPSLFQQAEETIGQEVIDDNAGIIVDSVSSLSETKDFHLTFSSVGQVSFVQTMWNKGILRTFWQVFFFQTKLSISWKKSRVITWICPSRYNLAIAIFQSCSQLTFVFEILTYADMSYFWCKWKCWFNCFATDYWIYFHLSLLTNAAIKFLITEYYPHLIAAEFPKKRDGARFTQDLTSLRIYSANLFVQLAMIEPSIKFSKLEEK